jgi:hypothetical protein
MLKKSRIATVMATLAVVSLAAPPAMANHRNWGGWGGHRHRDRVDTGDVLAGILILGGIAAVASAASNAKKKNKPRDEDYRYPDNDYPQRERSSGGYAEDDRDERPAGRTSNTGIDGAIDRCMDEVSRGSTKIDEVDSVNRDGDGWRVQGRTSGDGQFSCSIDGDGRIRNVSIDGRAV